MAEYFAFPLMMFLATPFYLRWLGETQYGQWMLLLALNGLGGLAGLGMGSAATRDVAAARGRGDPDAALASVRAAFSVTLVSSLVVGLAVAAAGTWVGADLLSRMGDPMTVRFILMVAAVLICLEQLDTVFAGTLRGMERFGLSAGVEAVSKATLVLVALAAAYITRDVRIVIASAAAVTALRLLLKMGIATALLGSVPWPSGDRNAMSQVFAFGKWTWAQSLGSALFSSADRLLIGGVLGAEALARYSVCLQLAQQVQTIPAAGAQFLFPAVSRRREAGEEFQRLSSRASMAVVGLALLLALPLVVFADGILTLWVGAEMAGASAKVLVVLAISFAMLAACVGPFYVLLASGFERYLATTSIVAGVAAIVLTALAIPDFGIIGAAVGKAAYAVVIMVTLVAPPKARELFLQTRPTDRT